MTVQIKIVSIKDSKEQRTNIKLQHILNIPKKHENKDITTIWTLVQ